MKIHVKIVHSTPVFPVIVLKQYKKKKKNKKKKKERKRVFRTSLVVQWKILPSNVSSMDLILGWEAEILHA